MNTFKRIITSILLITTISLGAMYWPRSEISTSNTHHVIGMEQTSPTTESLVLYWPGYFGVAKIHMYTWNNDQSSTGSSQGPEIKLVSNPSE